MFKTFGDGDQPHLLVVIQRDHADVGIFGQRVPAAGLHQSLRGRRGNTTSTSGLRTTERSFRRENFR